MLSVRLNEVFSVLYINKIASLRVLRFVNLINLLVRLPSSFVL